MAASNDEALAPMSLSGAQGVAGIMTLALAARPLKCCLAQTHKTLIIVVML